MHQRSVTDLLELARNDPRDPGYCLSNDAMSSLMITGNGYEGEDDEDDEQEQTDPLDRKYENNSILSLNNYGIDNKNNNDQYSERFGTRKGFHDIIIGRSKTKSSGET